MTKEDLLLKIGDYFHRNNQAIQEEVGRVIAQVADDEVNRLWEAILRFNSPSRPLGVDSLIETMDKAGIHRKKKPVYVKEEEVVCDLCGERYRWAQVKTETAMDACPECGFPHIEARTMEQYKELGIPGMWEEGYKKYKQNYLRELELQRGKR